VKKELLKNQKPWVHPNSASHSWFFARDSSVISDPAAGGDACGPSIPVGERHEIEEQLATGMPPL